MNHTELNMSLCKKSPFILKTKIEKEDRVSFNWNQLEINQKIIGWYAIKEEQDYFNIELHAEDYKFHDALVIKLDYKAKPILLTNARESDKLSLKTDDLDKLLTLIPEKQYLADEKAEL